MFPLISFFYVSLVLLYIRLLWFVVFPDLFIFCSVMLFIPKPRSEDTKGVTRSHKKTNNDQQNSTQKNFGLGTSRGHGVRRCRPFEKLIYFSELVPHNLFCYFLFYAYASIVVVNVPNLIFCNVPCN